MHASHYFKGKVKAAHPTNNATERKKRSDAEQREKLRPHPEISEPEWTFPKDVWRLS